MVIGIGCDIVDHALTENLNWDSENTFRRVFSQEELLLYENQKNKRFIAGRFAAKEAVVKCLGTGMHDGISLTDIQILQVVSGKPIVRLQGEVKKISDYMGIKLWHISISHATNCSFAFVIAEGLNPNLA